jgi:hypothetical protein
VGRWGKGKKGRWSVGKLENEKVGKWEVGKIKSKENFREIVAGKQLGITRPQ